MCFIVLFSSKSKFKNLKSKIYPGSGFRNSYGTMYNSVTLDPIAHGMVFLDKMVEPIETEDDGSWGNDHIPNDCKSISGTAESFANYFKYITITAEDDNEFDLPMDPIGG